MRHLLLVPLVLYFLSGCGAVIPDFVRADAAARYGEVTEILEPRILDYRTAGNLELAMLCKAYGEVKNYARLWPCVDELDARIARGDIVMQTPLAGIPAPIGHITPISYLARSRAYLELGDYDASLEYAHKTYDYATSGEAFGETGLAYSIDAMELLGMGYALTGDYDSARATLDSLEGTRLGLGFLLKTQKGNAMVNISMALGDYKRAQQALDEYKTNPVGKAFITSVTAAVAQTTDLLTASEVPRVYLSGKLLLETGDTEKARRVFDKLLASRGIENNGEIYWLLLFDRARIAQGDGDGALAIKHYGEAIEVIEAQRSTINTEVGKIGFVGDKESVYQRLIALLVAEGRYDDAFEYVERAKARALVDMLASKETLAPEDGSLSALITKLKGAEQALLVRNERLPADTVQRQRSVVVDLKDEVASLDPELASLVTVDAIAAGDARSRLDSGETLLEYYDVGDYLLALMVDGSGVQAVKLDGSNVRSLVQAYREQLMDRNTGAYLKYGKNLYQRLFEPLEASIRTRNITVVGHGPLHYLPFHALNDSDETFLIDRYRFRVLPSASVLKFLGRRAATPSGDLLAFGNPDLRNPQFDLPGAQQEVAAIANERPGARVLVRGDATETALKQYGGQFRYLHLATHGTFNPDTPMSSGLLMARDSLNDGTLTVAELYNLTLPADLVTLSACETALGRVASGDDVVGFTRGFLFAGVDSIVSSLWQVDDAATAELMTRFYRNLATMDRASALRNAMLEVKAQYNIHPYYWGAFQLTGSI